MQSLTIYLIKEWIEKNKVIKGGLPYKNIQWIWNVYYKKTDSKIPQRCSFFWNEYFTDLKVSSLSWIFLSEVKWRLFALTFWQWWKYLLNKWVCEERFWFLVSLNSIKEDSLRSLDVVDLDSVWLQKRLQSVKPDFSDRFWFDVEKDLVRSITWLTKNEEKYWKILTWKDSLNARLNINISDLNSYLAICLERFTCDEYKENFPRIDNISEATPSKKVELDEVLIKELQKEQPENLYLTIPDIIDRSEFWYFSFKTWNNVELFQELEIKDFKKFLDENNIKYELDTIKKQKIYGIKNGEDFIFDHWNIYNCFHFEYYSSHENKTFILNWWKRYEINNDIVESVNKYYEEIPDMSLQFKIPDCEDKHADENEYNKEFSDINEALCLDKKLEHIPWESSFEVCDVYTKNKEFVHIKKYYGSPSLSHLFNQWYVSAKTFLDKSIRKKINDDLLTGIYKITDIDKQNISDYSVVFGIITKNAKLKRIPFFSKLTLMRTHKELSNIWYQVWLFFIEDKQNKTKTCKISKKTNLEN